MGIEQQGQLVAFVDLGAQHSAIAGEVEDAISGVLHGTDFILGRELALFEEEFADFCGVEQAVGVDSGMSALELALRAYNIGPGDDVITVANTFVATALAISCAGATPVLVDVEPGTYNMDPSALWTAITARTRAIMPVHLYGHPADMDPIISIAHQHGLVVIEDACQAHGARYKERRAGSLGHAAAFSFYPSKNLGACGDGGMLVTNDERVADAVRILRNYGQQEKYHHVLKGYNRRLDTLQAAVLRVKLRHLDTWNAARRERAQRYNRLLADTRVVCPSRADYAEPVYHLYVIQVQERDRLQSYLRKMGVATGIHYPTPIHLQPAYRDLGRRVGSFPVTERCAQQILSLPMYAELSLDAIDYVAMIIRGFHAGS